MRYALKYLNRALEIEQNTTLNADNDRDLATTLIPLVVVIKACNSMRMH